MVVIVLSRLPCTFMNTHQWSASAIVRSVTSHSIYCMYLGRTCCMCMHCMSLANYKQQTVVVPGPFRIMFPQAEQVWYSIHCVPHYIPHYDNTAQEFNCNNYIPVAHVSIRRVIPDPSGRGCTRESNILVWYVPLCCVLTCCMHFSSVWHMHMTACMCIYLELRICVHAWCSCLFAFVLVCTG